jgi:hypothetical protein
MYTILQCKPKLPYVATLPTREPLASRGKFFGYGDHKLEYSVRRGEGKSKKREGERGRGVIQIGFLIAFG